MGNSAFTLLTWGQNTPAPQDDFDWGVAPMQHAPLLAQTHVGSAFHTAGSESQQSFGSSQFAGTVQTREQRHTTLLGPQLQGNSSNQDLIKEVSPILTVSASARARGQPVLSLTGGTWTSSTSPTPSWDTGTRDMSHYEYASTTDLILQSLTMIIEATDAMPTPPGEPSVGCVPTWPSSTWSHGAHLRKLYKRPSN